MNKMSASHPGILPVVELSCLAGLVRAIYDTMEWSQSISHPYIFQMVEDDRPPMITLMNDVRMRVILL